MTCYVLRHHCFYEHIAYRKVDAFDQCLIKGMAHRVEDRYQSMEELTQQLLSVHSTKFSNSIALILVAVCCFLIAFGISLYQKEQREQLLLSFKEQHDNLHIIPYEPEQLENYQRFMQFDCHTQYHDDRKKCMLSLYELLQERHIVCTPPITSYILFETIATNDMQCYQQAIQMLTSQDVFETVCLQFMDDILQKRIPDEQAIKDWIASSSSKEQEQMALTLCEQFIKWKVTLYPYVIALCQHMSDQKQEDVSLHDKKVQYSYEYLLYLLQQYQGVQEATNFVKAKDFRNDTQLEMKADICIQLFIEGIEDVQKQDHMDLLEDALAIYDGIVDHTGDVNIQQKQEQAAYLLAKWRIT